MDEQDAAPLFERLGYTFQDLSLFRQSITHKSFANENPDKKSGDNERLEFLGDAVLDLVVSDLLMERLAESSEGELSKLRARLVSATALAEIARELGLGAYLRMGKGEELSGGREKNSLLADALEALLAAIYLDSRGRNGMTEVARVIEALQARNLESAVQERGGVDFKTELQEVVQKRFKETVRYRVTREDGPDHDKRFEVNVSFKEREFGRGAGRSKKQAEQAAAKQALEDFRSGKLRMEP